MLDGVIIPRDAGRLSIRTDDPGRFMIGNPHRNQAARIQRILTVSHGDLTSMMYNRRQGTYRSIETTWRCGYDVVAMGADDRWGMVGDRHCGCWPQRPGDSRMAAWNTNQRGRGHGRVAHPTG